MGNSFQIEPESQTCLQQSQNPRWPKKPKAPAAHPPTATMVVAAIKALKERGGSSLPAIKKYIAANYKVDVVKLSPFIRKALKKGVEKKTLVQVKASYKLGKVEKPKKAKEAKEEEGKEAKEG